SIALSGYLASAVLRGFSATVAGITFGPLDTIFGAAALLILLGGIYAALSLRGLTLPSTTGNGTAGAETSPPSAANKEALATEPAGYPAEPLCAAVGPHRSRRFLSALQLLSPPSHPRKRR